MNFSFANPLLLWGMLLAALPIIIHLINRKKARKIKFSATYFVLLSSKKLSRSLKLKQVLLLIARTLLLLLLALLLARPYKTPEANLASNTKSDIPTTRLIIIDRSCSMQAKLDGEELFEKSKAQARELVTSFADHDTFALLVAPFGDAVPMIEPTFKREVILDAIENIKPSELQTDFSETLERSRLLLEGSIQSRHHIYLIGDATKVGYEGEFVISVSGKKVPISLIDMREAREIQNVAILDIAHERSYFTGSKDWKISVSVANYGSKNITSLPLSIYSDKTNLANGFVDLKAGETNIKSFIVKLNQVGVVQLEAKLPADDFTNDDSRFGEIDVSRVIDVLLVNGQPSTIRHLDEVFYLKQALNPGGLNRSRINPHTTTVDWFSKEDLTKFDVVFLCNVGQIPQAMADDLNAFAKSGKSVFIGVGSNVDVEDYNQKIPLLLPGKLRGERLAGTGTETRNDTKVVHLSRFDYSHPVFKVFDDLTARSLYLAEVTKYLTFDSDASRPKKILIRYSDNSPAMVEVPVAMGRSMFFSSSFSRTWNDIPIQPGFLPLIQELTRALVKTNNIKYKKELKVGERFSVLNAEASEVILTTPANKRIKLLKDKNNTIISKPLDIAGRYSVDIDNQNSKIIVNIDKNESDLRQLSPAQIEDLFAYASSAKQSGFGSILHGTKTEYSGLLSILLLIFFAFEVAVLKWMG